MPNPRKEGWAISVLLMCFDQTVCAVFSLVYDVDLFGLLILVYEEFMSDEVHLHDCFFCRHGLEVKGFLSDLEFGFFFYGLEAVSAVKECAVTKLFLESRFIFTDLSFDHVDCGINSMAVGRSFHFAAEDGTGGGNGELQNLNFSFFAELYGCLSVVKKELIQLFDLLFNQVADVIINGNLSQKNRCFHRYNQAFL